MATLKYFAFSFCILFIGMGSLRSQTITSKDLDLRAYRTRQILEAIKEKMHLPKGVVSGMRNDEESTLSVTIDSNEKISTSYPESEVHAAMNPTDSANIIIGPIHLDNGMILPI